MKDTIRRALRTFFQAFVGVFTLGWLTITATSPTEIPDWSTVKQLAISAAVAGSAAVASLLHNALEDAGVVKARK